MDKKDVGSIFPSERKISVGAAVVGGARSTSAGGGGLASAARDINALIGGLSIRDYFAAQAIEQAFNFRRPSSGGGGGSFEYAAEIAYKIADAMLAERAK